MYIETREYKVAANAFNFLIIERLVEGNWIEVQDKYFFRDAMYRTRAKDMPTAPYFTFRTATTTHMEEALTYEQRKQYRYIKTDDKRFVESIAITVFESEIEILIAKTEEERGLYFPKPPMFMLPSSIQREECEEQTSLHISQSGMKTVDINYES